MNPQIKEKWLNALRSGEYSQTEGSLKTDDGFCCLGVLCDLYSKEVEEEWVKDEITVRYKFDGSSQVLPNSVMDWAGLNEDNPRVYFGDDAFRQSIAEVNDAGHGFDKIAKIIEEQL